MKQRGQIWLTVSNRHQVYFSEIPRLDPCAQKKKSNCTTNIGGVLWSSKGPFVRTKNMCHVLGVLAPLPRTQLASKKSILTPLKSLCMPVTSWNSYFTGVPGLKGKTILKRSWGTHQNSQNTFSAQMIKNQPFSRNRPLPLKKSGIPLFACDSEGHGMLRKLVRTGGGFDFSFRCASMSASGTPKRGFDSSFAAYVVELISVTFSGPSLALIIKVECSILFLSATRKQFLK